MNKIWIIVLQTSPKIPEVSLSMIANFSSLSTVLQVICCRSKFAQLRLKKLPNKTIWQELDAFLLTLEISKGNDKRNLVCKSTFSIFSSPKLSRNLHPVDYIMQRTLKQTFTNLICQTFNFTTSYIAVHCF